MGLFTPVAVLQVVVIRNALQLRCTLLLITLRMQTD